MALTSRSPRMSERPPIYKSPEADPATPHFTKVLPACGGTGNPAHGAAILRRVVWYAARIYRTQATPPYHGFSTTIVRDPTRATLARFRTCAIGRSVAHFAPCRIGGSSNRRDPPRCRPPEDREGALCVLARGRGLMG